ncbi:MAG: phage baseplate assembly protein V, partial [Gemmatimonadota bacterium]
RTGELYQKYYGVYLGKVLGLDDPEGLGRVRVEVDQLRDTPDRPLWATVSRPLAGSAGTVFFTPRKGDQVVVAFLSGDPRQPIIMGYAHSRDRKPSDVGPRKHTIDTEVGRITFDEQQRTIEIEYKLAPPSTIRMGPSGVTIDAASVLVTGTLTAASISAGGGGATADGPGSSDGKVELEGEVCVNGHAVVLEPFISQVFDRHTHPAPGGTTSEPTPMPSPPNETTECSS